jgi:hypothetical protein
MKAQILLLGALFCLASPGQTPATNPNGNGVKQPVAAGQQSITGCVDERNGHYVLRDAQSSQLLSLQAPGSDEDSYFAKFVGHKVLVNGVKSSEAVKVAHIEQVADMCGSGK